MTVPKRAWWPSARSRRRLLSPNAVSDTASQQIATPNQVQSRSVSSARDSARVWRPAMMPNVMALTASTMIAACRQR